MKSVITFTILCLILGLGCNSGINNNNTKNEKDTITTVQTKYTNVVYTKYNIPLPIDLFQFLTDNDVSFNIEVLCNLSDVDKFTNETRQALALGIYSADIAVSVVMDKKQEVINYFNASQKIADHLDIMQGFNYAFIDRLEQNLHSKDSLSYIASESYWNACNYLDEKGKNNILPFVIYGGWIESQYILIEMGQKSLGEEKIKTQIAIQKQGLLNLINYLYEVMIESTAFYYNYDIKILILKLNNIKKIYDKIPVPEQITSEQYNEIKKNILSIRADIVSL